MIDFSYINNIDGDAVSMNAIDVFVLDFFFRLIAHEYLKMPLTSHFSFFHLDKIVRCRGVQNLG
jgi:hypothetical protein